VGEDLAQKVQKRLDDRIFLTNEPVQRYLGTVDPELKMVARMDLARYMGSLFQQYDDYYREIIVADAEGNPILRANPSRSADDATPLPGMPVNVSSKAPHPPSEALYDSLAIAYSIPAEEIPLLPSQVEKAEELARSMEKLAKRRLQVRIEKSGPEMRMTKESMKELTQEIQEGLSRFGLGPRDPDLLGPQSPVDPRLGPMIQDNRQFTQDERIAAKTGSRLPPGTNVIRLYRGPGQKLEAVRLVRPVFSIDPNQSDRRLGVMILDIRPEYLFPEDLSSERFGSKGEVAIVNRKDGEILYHSSPELISHNLRELPELAEKIENAPKDAKGSEWFSIKNQGGRKLGAIYNIDSANWAVITTAYPREFETEAREAGLLNLAVASAAVLLALGFLLVSSRKLSTSVHIVTEGAREIAAGNLHHTIRVKTRDEIQTLAETFNAMTASLRENIALRENAATELEALNRTLEDRVAERTRELQSLNEALGRANQELQELDRLKSNFLATVSHEFKTPLTSITAFSEILSDEMQERAASPEVLRFLNIINNESGRLGRLIRNLLDLSRIEARRMRWEHSTFRVKDVVEASMDGLLPVFSEKNIQIHRSIECPDARINADRDRIQQVITNLIENAVKFSTKGSRIWVDCHESNHGRNGHRYLEFSVKDEGPGIPPSHLVRIFERFTQVDNTDTRGTGGSGLGLAISKEIVEHHGGSIWVDSEEGIGATFHFTIPRLGEEAQ
jgi:signal transduction histidine kinase